MKKYILCFAMLMVCLLCLPVLATAQTTEEQIVEIVTQQPKVVKANCIIYERNCVVAIQTEKFTNHTEYCQFVDKTQQQIKQNCQVDHVYFSRSPRVMQEIEGLQKLEEKARVEKIQQMIERFLNKPMPLPYIQPTMD